jgi:hypothetical protein
MDKTDVKCGHYNIVKRCFWIQIKFITEDSNAIKLNEVILIRNYLQQKKKHQAN